MPLTSLQNMTFIPFDRGRTSMPGVANLSPQRAWKAAPASGARRPLLPSARENTRAPNLVEQAEPLAVPPKEFDPVSALSAEAEDRARAGASFTTVSTGADSPSMSRRISVTPQAWLTPTFPDGPIMPPPRKRRAGQAVSTQRQPEPSSSDRFEARSR